MPPTKRQLAASLLVCAHIADREVIAGFLADEATQVGTNPFRQTSVGAQLQIWVGHNFEFRSSRTEALGLLCLLRTLGELPRVVSVNEVEIRGGVGAAIGQAA